MPLKIVIFRIFVQKTIETNILICDDDSFAIVPLYSVDPQTYIFILILHLLLQKVIIRFTQISIQREI